MRRREPPKRVLQESDAAFIRHFAKRARQPASGAVAEAAVGQPLALQIMARGRNACGPSREFVGKLPDSGIVNNEHAIVAPISVKVFRKMLVDHDLRGIPATEEPLSSRGRLRRVFLVEKTLPPGLRVLNAQIVFVLNKLKSLGLSVVPTARLAIGKSRLPEDARLILTDLSMRGRLRVVDYLNPARQVANEVKGLANFAEIRDKIGRETKIAEAAGFRFFGTEWAVAIVDPATGKGTPYILDVKFTRMGRSLELEYNRWAFKNGLT